MEIFPHKGPKTEKIVPVAPLREGVIFPHVVTILSFGRPKSMAAVEAAYKNDGLLALFSQKDSKTIDLRSEDLYQFGTLAKVERLDRGEGSFQAWIRGIKRVKLISVEAETPFLVGKIEELEEAAKPSDEVKAFAKVLINDFQKAINLGKSVDVLTIMHLMGESDPASLVDQIAYTLELDTQAKQDLLETPSVKDKLEKVAGYLNHEIGVLKLEQTITHKTQRRFDKAMRETVLREKKKTIDEELGELSEEDEEVKELEKKVKEAKMPAAVEEKAKKELKRLSRMNPNHPEYSYIRTYLDWLVEMPWSTKSPNETDIVKAAKVLDEDHYGLEKIKERIVEYLAVMKLKNGRVKKSLDSARDKKEDVSGPTILCFIGPPGVGKTSIGKSIARALGRKFIRISLGGIRDEAEIRGHRRTYVGAMPGRIIQGIKNAGTSNPVFMLDEIDKVGADFRGDPSAALLEALDPEQNHEFSDHYLEVPFDLSGVMFITTGNILDTIPPALRDRMEVIRFSGYTEDEKFHIAKKFLWSKQLEANGLDADQIKVEERALYEIIRYYTREAGVRELERSLAAVCRKIAHKIADRRKNKGFDVIKKSNVSKFLGPRKYSQTLAETKDEAGIITGLAYTESGGEILLIEVALMPGKGNLLLTGQLGKIMQESAKAALSYVRSRWRQLRLKKDFYKDIDIHIHVPEGAVPKDGPSAGVAITTGLISALTKRKARREVGMTGEITLRGRVLEIGGVKEKLIAAHRAGLTTVTLPKDNKKDLVDVPDKVKKDIKFVFISHLDEVLEVALK